MKEYKNKIRFAKKEVGQCPFCGCGGCHIIKEYNYNFKYILITWCCKECGNIFTEKHILVYNGFSYSHNNETIYHTKNGIRMTEKNI